MNVVILLFTYSVTRAASFWNREPLCVPRKEENSSPMQYATRVDFPTYDAIVQRVHLAR